jgi:hypothetical protein
VKRRTVPTLSLAGVSIVLTEIFAFKNERSGEENGGEGRLKKIDCAKRRNNESVAVPWWQGLCRRVTGWGIAVANPRW